MDRKIRQIKLQCEREKKVAFSHMQKYLARGPTSVPTWMAYNLNFNRELAAIWTGEQYLQILKKYGRQFVLNPAQCRFLMSSANERPEKIEKVVKVKIVLYIKIFRIQIKDKNRKFRLHRYLKF